ncbi:MAG: hypothetical protein IJX38_04920 [Clostridia bacterium]|nr:hypothetical protein [Clostridia bacterium]
MKAIGVIKEIDNIGRIVIPKEMRERFNLEGEVEITMTEYGVLISNPKFILVEVNQNDLPVERQ